MYSPRSRRGKGQEICRPVKVSVLDPDGVRRGPAATYHGFVKNLSTAGMCIHLREGYNPLDIDRLLGLPIEIEMDIPSVKKCLRLKASVLWGMREGLARHMVAVGTRLVQTTAPEMEALEGLLAADAGDHDMLWDLWDGLRMSE